MPPTPENETAANQSESAEVSAPSRSKLRKNILIYGLTGAMVASAATLLIATQGSQSADGLPEGCDYKEKVLTCTDVGLNQLGDQTNVSALSLTNPGFTGGEDFSKFTNLTSLELHVGDTDTKAVSNIVSTVPNLDALTYRGTVNKDLNLEADWLDIGTGQELIFAAQEAIGPKTSAKTLIIDHAYKLTAKQASEVKSLVILNLIGDDQISLQDYTNLETAHFSTSSPTEVLLPKHLVDSPKVKTEQTKTALVYKIG